MYYCDPYPQPLWAVSSSGHNNDFVSYIHQLCKMSQKAVPYRSEVLACLVIVIQLKPLILLSEGCFFFICYGYEKFTPSALSIRVQYSAGSRQRSDLCFYVLSDATKPVNVISSLMLIAVTFHI